MRAFVVEDPNGKVVSATIIPDEFQADISPVAPVGHRLVEVDVTALIEAERSGSNPASDAIARALSRLAKGSQSS